MPSTTTLHSVINRLCRESVTRRVSTLSVNKDWWRGGESRSEQPVINACTAVKCSRIARQSRHSGRFTTVYKPTEFNNETPDKHLKDILHGARKNWFHCSIADDKMNNTLAYYNTWLFPLIRPNCEKFRASSDFLLIIQHIILIYREFSRWLYLVSLLYSKCVVYVILVSQRRSIKVNNK